MSSQGSLQQVDLNSDDEQPQVRPDVVVQEVPDIYSSGQFQMHEIKTDFGVMLVAVEGDLKKPCVFTMHDIGLNHESCFTNFFNCADAVPELLLNDLTRVHINMPGQEYSASTLEEDVVFDFQAMVDLIELVRTTLGIEQFFGIGVGCGAYLLLAYATKHYGVVMGLCLFGATSRKLGWIEWGKSWQSWMEQMIWGTNFRYNSNFIERWLGWNEEGTPIHSQYMRHIERMNPDNVNKFLMGYHARVDITEDLKNIGCPLLFFVGGHTPYDNEMVHITSTIGPRRVFVDSIREADTGILLTEHTPYSVFQPLELFFQALGYNSEHGRITSWRHALLI